MFGMGMWELIIVAIVALLALGPEKLPEAAKSLSRGIRDFRKQARELQETLEDDNEIGDALRDLKSALRGDEAAEQIREREQRRRAAQEAAAKNKDHAGSTDSSSEASPDSSAGSDASSDSAGAVQAATGMMPAMPMLKPSADTVAKGDSPDGSGSLGDNDESAQTSASSQPNAPSSDATASPAPVRAYGPPTVSVADASAPGNSDSESSSPPETGHDKAHG